MNKFKTLAVVASCWMAAAVPLAAVAQDPAAGTVSAGTVSAGNYPERPIRMIVAWPAGGGTDSVARIVARYLGERLKQPVIVENRGGASGMVGTEYVSRAAPDGYTIQYTVADSHSINPHVFADVHYDALNDFTPVVMVGSMPNALVVNPREPAKTVAEFVKIAKENPGKLTYSSWGIGSGGHIRMEAFDSYTHIKMLHVPYQGSGPALAAVLAGHVDAMMVPLGLAQSNIEAGKLRVLAVDTPLRVEGADGIPTFTEQGVPLVLTFWQGILVPAKVPKEIVDKLNRETNAVLADPQARADLLKVGVVVGASGVSSVVDTQAYFNAEYVRWGKVIRDAGIKAE
jgi:tripartite-type tricarboxylate transporter receptor subunit TctC